MDGAVVSVFTLTLVATQAEQPEPAAVTVTVYKPVIAVVALVVRFVLSVLALKPIGPLHR